VSTARTKTLAARNTRLEPFPETDLWNWPLVDGGRRDELVSVIDFYRQASTGPTSTPASGT
jgi:hypothetical protein